MTGDIVKQYMIDLSGVSDDQDADLGANSDSESDESSSGSSEGSDDAMNP